MKQGMLLLGAYFGAYVGIGFVYPLTTGENVLATARRWWGGTNKSATREASKEERDGSQRM